MAYVVGLFRLAVVYCALLGTDGAWLHGDVSSRVFFTTQSNLVLAVVLAWAGIASLLGKRQPPGWLKGAVTLFILITGLVAYLVLAPPGPEPHVLGPFTSTDLVHRVVPIAAFVDFLVCDEHRRLRLRYALWWLTYPAAYFAFALIRGAIYPHRAYPYPFVDVHEHGYGGVAVNFVVYGVLFWLLGAALCGIDRLMRARPLVGNVRPRLAL
jgi:hypothetical protein